MNRPRCFPLLLIAFSIMVYMHTEVNAGPLSLSFARSFRSGREIRTPFKGPGILVARGFGKRNTMSTIEDTVNMPAATTAAETTTIDKFKPSSFQAGNSGAANIYGDGYDIERIPIDWLLTEMATNPNLVRLLLHRLVDINGDGKISAKELTASPFESFEYF